MRSLPMILIVAWIVLVALSFFLSGQIEGGRNIDTGFRRLDVFFKWQIIAFIVAIAAAFAAWRERTLSRGLRWVGFAPMIVTALVIAGLVLFATFYQPPMPQPQPPIMPTAPATDG